MGTPSKVINRQFEARGDGGNLCEIQLGPEVSNEFQNLANAASVQLFQDPKKVVLKANRRYVGTLLLTATKTGGVEYTQLLKVSMRTNGSAIMATPSKLPIYTIVDGVFVDDAAFLFTVTPGFSGLEFQCTLLNSSGGECGVGAAIQLESWVQPPQPA